MITVSVVIPCYNRAETIAQAVESALCQTRLPVEVLVVDDGSVDSSADVAERVGARVIRLPKNFGCSTARNVGIRAASGDAIAWLDSDDYWEPNHLGTVAALLDRYPHAAVASSAIRLVGNRSGTWYGSIPEGPPSNVLLAAFYNTPIALISSIVRRHALLAVGGFDESDRCAQDFDLWLRMARYYKFVAARDLTVNYRRHANQISADPEQQWYATYLSRKRVLADVKRVGDDQLGAELEAVFRQRWAEDAQQAWDADRNLWLGRLLELAPTVPGLSLGLRIKWMILSRAPAPLLYVIRAIRARTRLFRRRTSTG